MLGIGRDIPERRVVEFNADAVWTPQEKKASVWLCTLILLGVGLPSLVVAVVSTGFNVGLAYSLGATAVQKTAAVLASLGFSLFAISIPVARPLIREKRPDLDRSAFWLWVACLLFATASAATFSVKYGEGYAVTSDTAPISARADIERKIEQLNREIDADVQAERWETRAFLERDRELAGLERQLRGMPVDRAPAPQAATIDASQIAKSAVQTLFFALVALLAEAGAAIGLSVASEAFVTVLRDRREQPVEDLVPEAAPLATGPRIHAGESIDGFALWIGKCLSPSRNGEVRPAQAFAHYETFCAANNVRARLNQSNFYTRFSQHLGAVYGIASAHSNGPVYRGVALFDDDEMGTLNGHASPFNGHAGTFN